jgi:signal transduction histidine kinase
MRSLGGDIISSFDLRINGVEVIKETVRTDLGELKNSREAMAKKLHADLAQHTADMKEAVASELKGFEDSRTDMAKKLHADLAQHTADMKEAVASELKGFDVELGEVRTTLAGGQDEWRKLVSTMHAKRSGATVAKPPKAAKTTGFTAETTPDFAGLPQAGGKRHHSSKKVKAGKGKSH